MNPYVKVGSRTQSANPPKPVSPAADMMRECEKTASRMNAPQRLRDAWKAIQDAEYARPVVTPAPVDCLDDETAEGKTRAMRTAGRFAGRVRATNHADAMATLAVRGFGRFTRFVSYRQAFADLTAFPAEVR